MADSGSAPGTTRSWRPFRVMAAVSIVLVIVQLVLGEAVSAVVSYPTTAVQLNSVGAILSAMNSAAGPVLLLHAFFGLLVLLSFLGTTVIAVRYQKRNVTTTAVLSFVSIILAVVGGYLWASSDFTNGGGVLLMVNGAIAGYGLLFLALYYTK